MVVPRAMRVSQWLKNVLVFAAPAGAGVLFESNPLKLSLYAFVSFSLAASAVYVANDIRDVERDRLHPRKQHRPIASGQLSIPAASLLVATCAAGSMAIALVLLPPAFVYVLAAYLANTTIYTLWGKHVPTVDVMQVALGFVLRAVAGAAATGVPLSQWFMAAAMFGSLLMVAGKRSSELDHVGEEGATRPVLQTYSTVYLHQMMNISASALLLTYALWALGDTGAPIREPWALVSFAPFVYAVFRYMHLSDSGEAERPEALLFVDRGLQLGAVAWLVAIGVGIYL